MGNVLPAGSVALIAIYDHPAAEDAQKAIPNAVASSVATRA
jgi:hypothetical protein